MPSLAVLTMQPCILFLHFIYLYPALLQKDLGPFVRLQTTEQNRINLKQVRKMRQRNSSFMAMLTIAVLLGLLSD